MTVNGFKQATDENVLSIRKSLFELGVPISPDPNSQRNVLLRQLIVSQTRYEIFDILEPLGNLPPEQAPDLAPPPDTAAVIIWAGTQLTDFQIARLQAVYANTGPQVQHGDTEALSRVLCNGVVLDQAPSVNEQLIQIMGGPQAVHQALDQELTHAAATRDCAEVLGGIVSQVLVYRPANNLFIRFDMQDLPVQWNVYGPTENESLIAPPLDAAKKIILLTIGHGGPQGHTSFPGRGLLSQTQIADLLGQTSRLPTVRRIPLQCFPKAAVDSWPGQGGAVSIDSAERSDDLEMQTWISEELDTTVRGWLAQF